MARYTLDTAALSTLFRERGDDLLTWFVRRTMDREAAVDLVAETFARAVSSRRRFRGSTKEEAEAWLFGIARNVLREYLRKGSVEDKALRRLNLEPVVPTEHELDRIERESDLESLRSSIASHLDALSDEQRSAVEQRVLGELSYADIAAQCDVTEQVVRARVSRALRTLRLRLSADATVKDLV